MINELLVPNFPNYLIDQSGKVKSIRTNKYIYIQTGNDGYKTVRLCNGKIQKRFLVHRLVLQTFTGEDQEKRYVDHIDNDRGNNQLSNLRWVTQSENVQKSYDDGNAHSPCYWQDKSGKKHPRSKPVGGYKDGKLVVKFESIGIARKSGYGHCDKVLYGIRNTCKGLIFKYL